MINYGSQMNDSLLEKSDEAFHGPIKVIKEIQLTDNLKVTSLFVYANGFITFNQPYTLSYSSMPKKLPINGTAMVFPFWTDVNLLNNGDVYYREVKDEKSFSQIQ